MATLTLTIPDPQVPRIQAALGTYLGLGRDANATEVQDFLVEVLKDATRKGEVLAAKQGAEDGFVPPDVT